MKNYVKIQSTITINVTSGLQHEDFSTPNANIPDRLKISSSWPKLTVLINEGQHWYPSEIASWLTVQALEKDGVLTIGAFSDTCEDVKVVAQKEHVRESLDTINKSKKVEVKEIDLAALAGK